MIDLNRFKTKTKPDKVYRRDSKRSKQPFKVEFVRVPIHWVKQLTQAHCLATYKLALHILGEAFRQQYFGGEIILSTDATGLPREARRRAIRELVGLKLIQVQQDGNQAVRVTKLARVKSKRRVTPE
jgi:hypothetical protein